MIAASRLGGGFIDILTIETANLNLVVRVELHWLICFNLLSIEESTVATLEVFQVERVVLPCDPGVMTTYIFAVEHDIALRIAANNSSPFLQFKSLGPL